MEDVICWWSGGVTSAVSCYLAIDLFGLERCKFIFLDTKNEHPDNERFKQDCEIWYGKKIHSITNQEYNSIQDVWRKHLSLNVASGAVCSYKLKRVVREKFQQENEYAHQVFGFEFTQKEFKRAYSLSGNHPKAKSIYPLLMYGLDKEDCKEIVRSAGIQIPVMYDLGFNNSNCFGTFCIQGGIGYWLKVKAEYPEKFLEMAKIEHELSIEKGQPVTILKTRKNNAGELMFLQHCPQFPDVKDLTLYDNQEMPIEILGDCNGFCGTDDLTPAENQNQLNLGL